MSTKSVPKENPYDTVPTDGDPYEPDDAPRPLWNGDFVVYIEPLDPEEKVGGGDIVLHPGDTTSLSMRPEQTQRWYSSGPNGTIVDQYAERVPNTGGHHHGGADRSEAASGRVSPQQIVLQGPWPQNAPSFYLSPVVCGRILHCVTFAGQLPINIFYDVRVPGLVEIQRSASLKLKQATTSHPSAYWATPSFAAKLQRLADEYHRATGDPITVTDGCLEWGGRFDLNLDWRSPHAEHFNGNTADIRSFDIRDTAAFQAAAAGAGLTVLVESNHYHVRG